MPMAPVAAPQGRAVGLLLFRRGTPAGSQETIAPRDGVPGGAKCSQATAQPGRPAPPAELHPQYDPRLPRAVSVSGRSENTLLREGPGGRGLLLAAANAETG